MTVRLGFPGAGVPGLVQLTIRASPIGRALPTIDFDIADLVFTAGMSKRDAPGPFDRAPVAQGKWDTSGDPDDVTFNAGSILGNVVNASFKEVFDYNQGAISFWITPEWDGNDGKSHHMLGFNDTDMLLWKFTNNNIYFTIGGQQSVGISTVAWTAGTTYHIVLRWSCSKTLDGTNYVCVSINDVHTFSVTTAPTDYSASVTANLYGNRSGGLSIDSMIEGFTIYRRVLWDGAYGDYIGIADEINAIYNAGAGTDPTEITGSWDVVFCLPTNQADEALQTTGEAWSHPHGSNILDARSTGEENCFACDAMYGCEPYAIYWPQLTAGSPAGLDDLPSGAEMTIGMWVWSVATGPSDTYAMAKRSHGNPWSSGWYFVEEDGTKLQAGIKCATTNASSSASSFRGGQIGDGKWHYITLYYNDAGDRKIYFALDGVWATSYTLQNAGVGAYTSDAANDFFIGRSALGYAWKGSIGWSAIWSDDHHSHGTDFIPPRTAPTPGGNLVEAWHLDEGTGATAAAQVTTPGHDCTISSGTWISTWEFEGTPPIPPILEYDGTTTSTVVADAVVLQDLADAAMTVEAWVRADSLGEGNNGRIFDKRAGGGAGWILAMSSTNRLQGYVECATTDANSTGSGAEFLGFGGFGHWMHVAMQFDDAGDRKIYLWMNGIPMTYEAQTAGVGAIQTDVGNDLYHGNRSAGDRTWDGAFGGWSRISDVSRYTNGVPFVPPGFSNPPAPDGNTIWQTDYSDGAGTTLTDDSGNANHGTITFGTGRWYNWVDCETIAPGHRVYQWGYMLASDGANDGIDVISQTGLTAGSNYVGRVPVKYGYSRRAQPRIRVYDETNGATIVDFDGPPLVGTHLVGAASATLVVTGAVFPYSLVGGKVYNIPDGSVGTITAVGGTNQDTITAPLAGGGSNDWNVGEQYMIVPPNESDWTWCEHFCWELPTIARHGVAADCTAFSVKLLNVSGEGALFWQQAEVQENEFDNPSAEVGAGNPWVPTGWNAVNVDAGDVIATSAGTGTVHSGNEALEWITARMATNEYYYWLGLAPPGAYVSCGWWLVSNGTEAMKYGTQGANRGVFQSNLNTVFNQPDPTTGAWWHARNYVIRSTDGASRTRPVVGLATNPSGPYYVDDGYMFELDLITLTVTPSTEANSLEGIGLRIDGDDRAPANIPVGDATATYGHIRWGWQPRHDAAELFSFGDDSTALHVWGDANNYIRVYATAANQITLEFNDGGGVHTVNWNCAGAITADTLYQMEVIWGAANMRLLQDSVTVAQIVTPINFATVPTIVYWGNAQIGNRGSDAVFSAP